MAINNHKYIKLLEFVIEKTGSYPMRQALDYAKMGEMEFLNIRDSIFINANMQAPPPGVNEIYDWRLRPEAVFGYLNYKQYAMLNFFWRQKDGYNLRNYFFQLGHFLQ